MSTDVYIDFISPEGIEPNGDWNYGHPSYETVHIGHAAMMGNQHGQDINGLDYLRVVNQRYRVFNDKVLVALAPLASSLDLWYEYLTQNATEGWITNVAYLDPENIPHYITEKDYLTEKDLSDIFKEYGNKGLIWDVRVD